MRLTITVVSTVPAKSAENVSTIPVPVPLVIFSVNVALELRVAAEGVETTRQMEILRFLGCTRMQGHHFAHAMDPRDFEVFYTSVQGRPKAPWAGIGG
jgi:sensor c-di-GMP phosphodiesterase-like protein